MAVKDLKGPPPRNPREIALTFELFVRLNPELDWWPRWRDGGDDAGAIEPMPARPPSLDDGAGAAMPKE
ncbi:hypothetical protein [Sphingomonas sp. 8AM]|uniref:hypothetical protein n=1 Tax=Sphingomonas sp. 8AM TaxID=2653170 RepID=UPI0012F3937C|nr:hypothetical protein [Sphingomonas sp. 8AM]VXC78445.1 conserved hypothetical protein [Sphingomonas sp. 8AM]